LAGGIAHGYTVGFDTLGGANGTPFAGHSEGGFTVTPITGDWRVGQLFGDPVPSIFGVPPTLATVRVTDTVSGLFNFSSVNLAGITSSTATYTVEGFRNNGSVLVTSGTLNIADVFFNITSPNPATVLDRLDIAISPNSTTSFNVDNIVLNHVVPEPSTLALLAMCSLVGFVARRSRRAAT
jgi:hypothetical protein